MIKIAIIENNAPPARIKYLTQGFIPVRAAVRLATSLV
jgi:hypothetical protein